MTAFLNFKLWAIFLLGFSSGLPFLLTLSTLSFWLTESGVSKTTIGSFMLISLPYSLKFLWAPFVDSFKIPLLSNLFGQRRSWALLAQSGIVLSIIALGFCKPSQSIQATAVCALLVAIFSATQDIVYDAYRIEIISDNNRGIAAALESVGFRFGMMASGAGALYLAAFFDWQTAYHLMALTMIVGFLTVIFMPEPATNNITKQQSSNLGFKDFILSPWKQFPHKKLFLSILSFIFCFKLADAVLNSMSAPFLYELGFSKTEFADITKVFGITLMVMGGVLGGLIIKRWGTVNTLIFASILESISCIMFVIQSIVGYNYQFLVLTIGIESLCSGLISTAFIAYISGFCSQPYTASHFTLLYSIGSLSRIAASASAGLLADHFSWKFIFSMCSIFVIPSVFFLCKIEAKRKSE